MLGALSVWFVHTSPQPLMCLLMSVRAKPGCVIAPVWGRTGPGSRTGVAVAHLPIDVRAAGAIGAEAVHGFVGDDVHRQWGQRRTVLDLLAGPQNPNDEGPVIESSSPQVLTVGQRDDDWRVVRRSIAASCRGRAAEAAISTPAQARLTA
jgi:hypothetical protein